jgi:ABC-2 type transport system permease protein
MSAFTSLSSAALKGFFRDKVALFFSFAFPLMFIVIFGLIFSDEGAEKIEIGITGSGPVISALESTGAFELKEFDSFQEAFAQVEEGEIPAVVAAEGNNITLRYAASDQIAAATVRGIVEGVVNDVNLRSTGAEPRYQVRAAQVEDSSLKPIQFIVPGMMSWGVALGAVFGSAFTLVSWRKKQVLRRIRSAPVNIFTVLGSRLVATLMIGVVQAVVFIGVGMLPFFGLKLSGQWWLAIPLLLLGIVAFFAVGLLIGSVCKTEEATSGVANAVIVPMAFLSGVFFPLDGAPSWMVAVSDFMPLKHMNEGMSDFLVRTEGPAALVNPALVLTGFTVVTLLVAARVFKWESS